MRLEKYFDLSIIEDDDKFYSVSDVIQGKNGGDKVGDEYYFSLYHIKNTLAKGELKEFLEKFDTTEKLAFLGKEILDNYQIEDVFVQYANHHFPIRKYPLTKIVEYFLKTTALSGSAQANNVFAHNNNINMIGFSNFRRFSEQAVLDIGSINMFVGQNNSGKSTFIKAILLMINYLQTKDYRKFSLTNENDLATSVLTFERALNKDSLEKNNELITFNVMLDDNSFEVKLSGNLIDSEVPVREVFLRTQLYSCQIKITGDYLHTETQFFRHSENDSGSVELKDQFKKRIDDLKKQADEIKKKLELAEGSARVVLLSERVHIMDQIAALTKHMGTLKSVKKLKNNSPIVVNLEFEDKYISKRSIPGLFSAVLNIIYQDPHIVEQDEMDELLGILERIKGDNEKGTFVGRIESLIEEISIHHLGTNNGKQNSILLIRDKDDRLAQVTHEYYQLKIDEVKEHPTKEFIKKWLGKDGFDIATDIRVRPIGGEGYSIELKDGRSWTHLAERGMGSHQLILILFKLATIIEKEKEKKGKPLLLIEEPEINLHPMLQTLLTDLMFEVYLEYGFLFIVETHSEYIIKNTQVIVNKNKLESLDMNPFKVQYFPKTGPIYQMSYDTQGKFLKDFGPGFMDESRRLSRKLL